MTGTPLYGLDKEIAKRLAEKYDPEREKQAREWLEEVTGIPFPNNDFQSSLKDGVILCKAINAVVPNAQLKPSTSKIAFKQMENINMFVSALNDLGVPKYDQFQTVDLYEGKNIVQVIDCIFAFSRHAVSNGYQGPLLGPKLAEKRELQFSDTTLNKGKTILTLQTSGNLNGANQSGMHFGGRREPGGFDPGKSPVESKK